MKKIDSVLTHFVSQPIYAKLQRQTCFRLVKKALPASLQRGILFIYVKNRTLFFAVKHPAFKMEFDYKLSLIKNLLSTLPPLKEACKTHEIKEVKAFVSKFAPVPKTPGSTDPHYTERARGRFEVHAESDEIKAAFEEIKKTIERNCAHDRNA
jgi:hypothetical protein